MQKIAPMIGIFVSFYNLFIHFYPQICAVTPVNVDWGSKRSWISFSVIWKCALQKVWRGRESDPWLRADWSSKSTSAQFLDVLDAKRALYPWATSPVRYHVAPVYRKNSIFYQRIKMDVNLSAFKKFTAGASISLDKNKKKLPSFYRLLL